MIKVSSVKRFLPLVVIASVVSLALLAGCSCSSTNGTADDEAVVEDDTVVVIPGDTDAVISKDEAKAIALKDAGLAEADVTQIQVTENMLDGASVYEVVFYSDDVKYEYVLDAVTGDVIEFVVVAEGVGDGGATADYSSGSASGSGSASNAS